VKDRRLPSAVTLALTVLGFGITLWVFYPGVMTYDARYVYGDIWRHSLGDWQSPVMGVLWGLVDPIAPGSGSIFLVTAAVYWLGFWTLAFALLRRSFARALLLLLLALMSPAFVLLGVIWRDILFGAAWLLAAALCFSVAERKGGWRLAAQAIALGLIVFGVLLRQNAVIAAPLLAAYTIWPERFHWKRVAIFYLPAALGFYLLIPAVYYGLLDAKRQNPLHSILVYDLGGVTHFARENQFPTTWTPEQTEKLTSSCYRPTEWNIYWTYEPCDFVMQKLEAEKLFGSPALPKAWVAAVTSHPLAYLQHRFSFFDNFLWGGENVALWPRELDDPKQLIYQDRPAFQALVSIHDALKPTVIFRAGTWLAVSLFLALLAWRRRDEPVGAFMLCVCGSGAIYMLTFLPVGVASDFRYAYWAVLASLAGLVTLRA